MKVNIVVSKNFTKEVKPLLKKFASLTNDILRLGDALEINPRMGSPLGNDAYKIRLKITSKGKGKSGGARVITLVETVVVGIVDSSKDETIVNLLTIYDKADLATITDNDLKKLIREFKQNTR